MMEIREKLQKWMDKEGLKQVALSQATGMSQSAISSILSGNTKLPSYPAVLAFAKAMECDLAWLIDESRGYPMVTAGPHPGQPTTPEDSAKLEVFRMVDQTFGPGTAMARLLGGERQALKVVSS